MDIITLIGYCILLAILWESGIIGIVIIACIIAFLWESKIIQWLLIITGIVIAIIVTIEHLIKIKKYKNETPQERAERLKTEQMIEDWRKQFK